MTTIKEENISSSMFVVMIDNTLTEIDRQVLNDLYGPIIKKDCIKFYLYLYDLIEIGQRETRTLSVKALCNNMRIKEDKFVSLRKMLEAVGLLSTYYNDGLYALVVKKVLSPYEFFNNKDLRIILSNSVSSSRFEELSYMFVLRRFNVNKFNNISANFDDVFESFENNIDNPEILDEAVNTSNNGINICNSDFDLNCFYILMDAEKRVKKEDIDSKEVLERVVRLSFLYHLDPATMRDVCVMSLDDNLHIDLSLMDQTAKMMFDRTNKNMNYIPKKETKKTGNKEIDRYNSLSPNDLVKERTGINLLNNEIEMFDSLLRETGLPVGVLNVCIEYVLDTHNNRIMSKAYYKKILTNWQRANVSTAKGALDYINNEKTKKAETKKTYYKKEVKPRLTWESKDNTKDTDTEEISEESMNEFLAILNSKK